MKTIGVIGAGVMGSDLSLHLAQSDLNVLLIDVDNSILEASNKKIRNNLRFQTLFNKKIADIESVMSMITFSKNYDILHEADFVIENATEKWEIKNTIYPILDRVCRESCVIAANTSALSITRLAAETQRADKVLGIHFMNPVHLKPTVEMIRGFHTSNSTLKIAEALMKKIDKDWILVNDWPGFVTNRVLMLTINEAIYLLQDQVAESEDVDRIFKSCFGHKMGPLETADLIGLDTILYSIEVLYESFNDSKYRPSPLLKKMVDAGMLGVKSGQGFYSYTI
nr:3-hydroxyacyl-CoA dehydrogenase NAD-binding domain-containing protein [Paenibacillus xylanexedens]